MNSFLVSIAVYLCLSKYVLAKIHLYFYGFCGVYLCVEKYLYL